MFTQYKGLAILIAFMVIVSASFFLGFSLGKNKYYQQLLNERIIIQQEKIKQDQMISNLQKEIIQKSEEQKAKDELQSKVAAAEREKINQQNRDFQSKIQKLISENKQYQECKMDNESFNEINKLLAK